MEKMAPAYPELARRMRINGTVKLEVIVAPNGVPKSPKALGGHPLLVQAATDAISKWRWAPSTVETTELIEVKFNPD
jgi:TonB family protein